MELRSKPNPQNKSEADQYIVIDADLTKWWNEVDEYLELNANNSQTPTISRFHQITLAILRCESIIALNRSVLATSKNSSYNAALQNCIGASRTVVSTLHKTLIVERRSLNTLSSVETPLLWPSFTWAVWMSAFITIYAANEGQTTRDVALRWVYILLVWSLKHNSSIILLNTGAI